MTLNNQLYNKQLALARSGKRPDSSQASAKQKRALAAAYATSGGTSSSSKPSQPAQASKNKASNNKTLQLVPQQIQSRPATSANASRRVISHADYKHLFVARHGSGPIPRPHFTAGMGPRYTAVSGRTGNVYVTLAAGASAIVMPVIAHGSVGLGIFSPQTNPDTTGADWTYANIRATDPYSFNLLAYAKFPVNMFSTVAPGIFAGAADRYSQPSVDSAMGLSEAHHIIPWCQLQGGQLKVDVSTVFDGQARAYTVAYGRNPVFSCAPNGMQVIDNRSAIPAPQGMASVLRLPTVPVTGTITSVFSQFGEATQIAGNSTRSFALALPADKGWYHPGSRAVAADPSGGTGPFNGGFTPNFNPIFAMQYGAVMIANVGAAGTTVSIAAQCKQSYVVTWPDFAFGDATATSDPVRVGLIAKAKHLVQTVFDDTKGAVRHLIGANSSSVNNPPPSFKIDDTSHHESSAMSAVQAGVGGAMLEHQTGFLSKALTSIRGALGGASETALSAAERFGPTVEEVVEGAEAVAPLMLL